MLKKKLTPQEAMDYVFSIPSIQKPTFPLTMFMEFDYYELEEIPVSSLLQKQMVQGWVTDIDERLAKDSCTIPEDERGHWKEVYNRGGVEPPLVLGCSGMTFDGMHRLIRAVNEGRENIFAYVGKYA